MGFWVTYSSSPFQVGTKRESRAGTACFCKGMRRAAFGFVFKKETGRKAGKKGDVRVAAGVGKGGGKRETVCVHYTTQREKRAWWEGAQKATRGGLDWMVFLVRSFEKGEKECRYSSFLLGSWCCG